MVAEDAPRALRTWCALAMAAFLLLSVPSGVRGAPPSPPPLEGNVPGELLAFSSESLEPGGSGTLTATLTDPSPSPVNGTITAGTLEVQVYRFAYEGQSQNLTLGDAWAVTLSPSTGGSSFSANGSFSPVAPGSSTTLSFGINVPASATAGSYFVRDRFNFTANGISYVTASRGFFSNAVWDAATLSCSPSGTCTPVLNLSVLGVSGVSPETSISVTSPWTPVILGAVLAAAAALAIAAGYVAFRRRGRPVDDGASRSGAKPSPRRTKAAKALGKRRTSDGD